MSKSRSRSFLGHFGFVWWTLSTLRHFCSRLGWGAAGNKQVIQGSETPEVRLHRLRLEASPGHLLHPAALSWKVRRDGSYTAICRSLVVGGGGTVVAGGTVGVGFIVLMCCFLLV